MKVAFVRRFGDIPSPQSLVFALLVALLFATSLEAQPAPADRASVLVHLTPGADRGPLRAFAAQNNGNVQYEYGVLPNVVNLRGLPPGLLTALQNVPGVERVEEDGVVRAYLGESIAVIQADQDTDLQNFGANGSGVRVCVLDGGIDPSHKMFENRVDWASGWDFANGDPDPYDDTGHGTHVSGTIAGAGTTPGVAPGATIVPVKVLANGTGSFSDVIAGMDYCAGLGVDGDGAYISSVANVINLSLGGGQFKGTCDGDSAAIAANNAVAAGLVVVAASGNDGFSDSMGTPACASNVIAVGATYDKNYSTSFSWCTKANRFFCTQVCTDSSPSVDDIGCYSNKSDQLDVAAPGCEISSAAAGTTDGLATMCGTSMAAPHVAGLAALLLDENPGLYPIDPGGGQQNVRDCIRGGADDRGSSGFDPAYGYGRINAFQSLNACSSGGVVNDPPTVTITSPADGSSFEEGASISFSGSASDTEDGDLTANLEWTSDIDGGLGQGGSFSKTLSVGVHIVTASVTDSHSESGSDSITVTVNSLVNDPPTVTISSPADGSSFAEGTSVSFSGSASDTEDGDLTASLVWTSNLDAQIGTGGSFSTSTLSAGSHTITASVTDSDGAFGNDSITVTINAPSADLTVTGITPDSVAAGGSADVTISGSGFIAGAAVSLENGSGPSPDVSAVTVEDGNTITASISTKSGGPPRDRIWDVRVTNPDGSSAVLPGSFTVTP